MKKKITKAFISFRIGVPQWMPEKRFRELMQMFEKYKGVTDEITFFTSETHPPLPLDTIRARADLLAKRMPEARKLGYRAGINILATIGHHNENLPNSLSGDFTHMTDMDGKICLGSFCPNDEKMRGYIRELYRLVANAKPDFIWIDDDVRLAGHWPIESGCFCDNCLKIFEKETGRAYTREKLKQAFNDAPLSEKVNIRKLWLEHNRNTIARLFELIEKTVHEIAPALPLGFMTGDRFFEGYDFDKWAAILAGPQNAEVMWRPGGGFYSDETLNGLIDKAHAMGRQISRLPEKVISIQSEIENFPYNRLKKAAHTTALEAAAHIAAGCTGAAFNVLSMRAEPLDEFEPLVKKLHAARPFYDRLVAMFGRNPPQGIYTGWNKDTFVTTAGSGWTSAPEIFEIGLPAAYSLENARATVLSASTPLALSDAEIKKILSAGVYLDDVALKCLDDMGYGKLTGFKAERSMEVDCIEQFTNDPLNGPFASRERDCRQSFACWTRPAAVLTPTSDKARILSRIIDYADKEVAPCTMGAFENELGGRVCVSGYFPWTYLQNLSKSVQIKSIMRWLSRDSLPAYVSSYHKVNLWARRIGKDKIAVALINVSLDEARDVELMIRTDQAKARVIDMECKGKTAGAAGADLPYTKFMLPVMQPWHMRLVISPG